MNTLYFLQPGQIAVDWLESPGHVRRQQTVSEGDGNQSILSRVRDSRRPRALVKDEVKELEVAQRSPQRFYHGRRQF
jgi:hypothetical protein